MVYIPNDWLINKDNADKVHDIFSTIDTDIRFEEVNPYEKIENELRSIGENILADKLIKGEMALTY